MIYYELLREYKRHCSTQEELETLLELDRITTPWPWSMPTPFQPTGHIG